MLSKISQRINLTLGFISALLCLSPIIYLDEAKNFPTDDTIAFKQTIGALVERSPSLLASFFVVLIPAADLLLDLPSKISSYWNCSAKESNDTSVVVRLNDPERFLFMLGICIQSSVWFLPPSTDLRSLSIVYFCTTNASFLLVGGSILTFLQRCTETFSTLRATLITVAAVVGFPTMSLCNFVRYDNRTYHTLNAVGWFIAAIGGIVYASLILLCAFKYCRVKLLTASDRQALLTCLLRTFRRTGLETKGIKDNSADNDSELYTNYIPGVHMAAMLMVIVASMAVGSTTGQNGIDAYECRNYAIIVAEIVVLVVELRIRKNEIARGLIALLLTKKSYVRYISHELRTPLNTAFLGLKLLSSDLKASKNPKDIERYETLCDVNMSCMAAVDILNDLLCYEKLESGILELHKENIMIEALLVNCLTMFSGQARECGVTMAVATDGTYIAQGISCPVIGNMALSLLPHDVIFADKFKMDQVIRNLVSNALKFTPRGGSVTINAAFVHDFEDELLLAGSNPSAEPSVDADCVVEVKGIMERKNKVRRDGRRDSRKLPSVRSVKIGPDTVQSESEVGIIGSDGIIPGKLVIVVRDTGAGISEENQKRLFNEIVQFNPEKLQAGGGSGLGLWITHEILNLHDGAISVYSEGEGMGSSFTIEMPMTRRPIAPPSPTAAGSGSGSGSSGPVSALERQCTRCETDGSEVRAPGLFFGHESISHRSFDDVIPPDRVQLSSSVLPTRSASALEVLVVDDSRLNRKMLLKCLQADGHICFEAADGAEAVAMVKERIGHANGGNGRPFDAILMDFIMPNMDGPTATKEIRALGYTSAIFGVTGNGLPSDIAHFTQCGADRVLLKPLDISAFGQAMKAVQKSRVYDSQPAARSQRL